MGVTFTSLKQQTSVQHKRICNIYKQADTDRLSIYLFSSNMLRRTNSSNLNVLMGKLREMLGDDRFLDPHISEEIDRIIRDLRLEDCIKKGAHSCPRITASALRSELRARGLERYYEYTGCMQRRIDASSTPPLPSPEEYTMLAKEYEIALEAFSDLIKNTRKPASENMLRFPSTFFVVINLLDDRGGTHRDWTHHLIKKSPSLASKTINNPGYQATWQAIRESSPRAISA